MHYDKDVVYKERLMIKSLNTRESNAKEKLVQCSVHLYSSMLFLVPLECAHIGTFKFTVKD